MIAYFLVRVWFLLPKSEMPETTNLRTIGVLLMHSTDIL